MKTYLDCLPCFMNQALRAARAANADKRVQREVMNAVAGIIPHLPLDLKPPEIARRVYQIIGEITGNNDPFSRAKAEANRAMLADYPRLKEMIQESQNSLAIACKLAIAGNSIDLGANFEYGGIDAIVETATTTMPPLPYEYDRFRRCLDNVNKIIYLGDNAGEIVFDRLFIEEIKNVTKSDIYFVVREKPIINDVTMDDAISVGMEKTARVVSSGSDAPATVLSDCSEEFMQLYNAADIIISKGQGNYESLESEAGNVFFLLRAKCSLVARALGVNIGDCVIRNNHARVTG